MIIGYERATYAEQRLFLNKCKNASYHHISSVENPEYPDFFNANERFNSSWIDKKEGGGVDLVHYFNQINFGSLPFVVTYETIAPRFWTTEAFSKGIEVLLSDKCRAIIAMSQSCYDLQKGALAKLDANQQEILMSKTHLLHPPQELLMSDLSRFDNIQTLKLVFVGRDFINKGGIPMLKALKCLIDDGYCLELHLVSSLKIIDNTTNSGESEITWIKQFIADNANWLHYYAELPNSEVLSLIRSCHVGLLPTLAETYGYSVLEMQAAGVPVISTNIRALAEINNINWLIELPYKMRPIIQDKFTIPNLYDGIERDLKKILVSIFANLPSLKNKAIESQNRIANHHNLESYSDTLCSIYQSALQWRS